MIIPALDEEAAVGLVVEALPAGPIREVVVVDNGSRDATAAVARRAGATVLTDPRRGYGRACLTGLAYLRDHPPDIVVFVDADNSDDPGNFESVIQPVLENRAEMVIGSRRLGQSEPGSMTPPQRFGNLFATWLIAQLTGDRFTDLGPFRALRWQTLESLEMEDTGYGWTVEMQIKAALRRVRWAEVPVAYRKRVGTSKISGTVRGVTAAGGKILYTVFREVLRPVKESEPR